MEIALLVAILVIVLIRFEKLFRKIEGLEKKLFNINKILWKESTSEDEQSTEVKAVKPTEVAEEEASKLEDTQEESELFAAFEEQEEIEVVEKEEEVVMSFSDAGTRDIRPETEVEASIESETLNSPPKTSFLDKYPDLERFVGENLVNKIGIGILVLGIGYFVKYAIDQNWINEIARVAIGIGAGGILIAIAHRLRNSFKSFSSVLVGGGISVLYFTIAIAYHQYEIIDQGPAFAIMVVITAFAVFLSTAYNKVELAVLSLIGGFATPFILSSGEGNYIVLFTYLSILNVGMLVLAYFRKWNLINYLSYIFTVIVFGGWLLGKAVEMDPPPYFHILIFATLFYFIFFVMNVINNIKAKRKFNAGEISLLLSNTFLYYAVGLMAFKHLSNGDLQGLFTATLGVINFVFAVFLYKKDRVDKNLVYLLIGLVLTFVTLAGPVQLEGNYITLFWSAESVLLLWLAYKSGIRILGTASVILVGLMLFSLFMDWSDLYFQGQDSFSIMFNKGYMTGLFSVICLLLLRYLLNKNKEYRLFTEEDQNNPGLKIHSTFAELGFNTQNLIGAGGVLVLFIFYLVNLLEFNFQLDQHIGFSPTRSVILASYHFTFALFLYALGARIKSKELLNFSLLAFFVSMLSYLVYYNFKITGLRNEFLLSNADYLTAFIYHYLDFALIITMSALLVMEVKKKNPVFTKIKDEVLSIISIFMLFLLSIELDHLVCWIAFEPGLEISSITTQNHKIGFPLLWGLCAFVIMWVGMKFKYKTMRIVALGVLLITLLKLFLYDIRDVSEAGKIIAFICLGILLLVISFMYQRLKKLIIDDGEKKEDKTNESEADL